MPEEKPYNKRLTIIGLEAEVRNAEAVGYEATAIKIENEQTGVTYGDGDVADYSFVLWVDPTGKAVGPKGSKAIFRGDAMVSGTPQKVAAFRKG